MLLHLGPCLDSKSQFNCFQLPIESAMTLVIFPPETLFLQGERMHLLGNYSFPAEVMHHYEVRVIQKA